ncbi:glycosyltransferase family 61 protein [Helicobacter sp. 23-1045]
MFGCLRRFCEFRFCEFGGGQNKNAEPTLDSAKQTKITDSALISLKSAILAKRTTLHIPANNPKIHHLNSAKIGVWGGIFKNGKIISNSINSSNIATHTQKQFDYVENLNIFHIRSLRHLKDFAKKIFFTHINAESRRNRQILRDENIPKVIFFCTYFSNMYHFIFEGYARLLLILDFLQNPNAVIIAPPKYRGFQKYHRWFIDEILEFIPKDKILYLDYQNYSVKNIYFCSNPQLSSHINTAIQSLQKRFYEADSAGFERVYISRKKSPRRFLINDDEIAEILQTQFGFKRVFMEDYNLKQKINLMMRAKILIAVEGTSAINGLFMTAPNAKLITLRSYDMTEHILAIAGGFKHISFLPIICEYADKSNAKDDLWVEGNLYLPKEYLLQKLKDYEVDSAN